MVDDGEDLINPEGLKFDIGYDFVETTLTGL
jgi:hypothetical protein